jgi:hypothetical protein
MVAPSRISQVDRTGRGTVFQRTNAQQREPRTGWPRAPERGMGVQQPNLFGVDAAGDRGHPSAEPTGAMAFTARDAPRGEPDAVCRLDRSRARRSSSAGRSGSIAYSPSRKSGRAVSRARRASLRYCHHSQPPAASPATSKAANTHRRDGESRHHRQDRGQGQTLAGSSQDGLGRGGNFISAPSRTTRRSGRSGPNRPG